MPGLNVDTDPQQAVREQQYAAFVRVFHALKAEQNNGKDPTYDLLATTLQVSKSKVSEWRQRMRKESEGTPSATAVPPELAKAFRRALDQTMVQERSERAEEVASILSNEASLARSLEQAETALLGAQATIRALEQRLTAAEASRDQMAERLDRLQESYGVACEQLGKVRATLHLVTTLKGQGIDALSLVTETLSSSDEPVKDLACEKAADTHEEVVAPHGKEALHTGRWRLSDNSSQQSLTHPHPQDISSARQPRRQRWRPLAVPVATTSWKPRVRRFAPARHSRTSSAQKGQGRCCGPDCPTCGSRQHQMEYAP